MTVHSKAAFATSRRARSPKQLTGASYGFIHDVLALRPALLAFARRLTTQDCDAEDLVHDTLVLAIVAQHQFAAGTNLKAWLFTIMRNSFNTRWRRSGREVTTGSEVIELSCATPATQESGLWARQALDCLLHDIAPAHREVLILVPIRGFSYEEAARICGCSVGTVKSRLNRARVALETLVHADPS